MTENVEPGVTVEELLDRVRAEVARRRGVLPAAAPPSVAVALAPDFQHLQVLLSQATRIAEIGTTVPPFGLYGPVRRALARTLTRVLYFFLQVISVDQGVFNGLILQVLRGLSAGLRQGETALAGRFDHLIGLFAASQERLAHVETEMAARTAGFQADVAARTAELRVDVAARTAELQVEVAARTAELQVEVAARTAELRREIAASAAARNEREAAQVRQALDLAAQLAAVRADLDAAYRRVASLEAAQAPGAPAATAPPAHLDALYVAFEDRFRGARAAIVERVREHLPTVQAAEAGTAERPILDLGCGRGEWLEVLGEADLHACGVDANPLMVEQCRARGLAVALDDALAHLRIRPDASCGAVTAVHLVEHLPFATLIALLDETVRVLAPGGVAIFETPNAYHLLVGACTFHTDPTHQHPFAPEVLAFLAEARGLARVEIRKLYRTAPPPPLGDASVLLQRLAPHLQTAEDFAVIGYRT